LKPVFFSIFTGEEKPVLVSAETRELNLSYHQYIKEKNIFTLEISAPKRLIQRKCNSFEWRMREKGNLLFPSGM
jgi:hypothetical protein